MRLPRTCRLNCGESAVADARGPLRCISPRFLASPARRSRLASRTVITVRSGLQMNHGHNNVSKPVCLWAVVGLTGAGTLLMIWLILPPREPRELCDAKCQLSTAAATGDLDEVRNVLRDHRDLSKEDLSTALRMAAMCGQEAVVDELLLTGADVNGRDCTGMTALFSAVIPWEGGDRLTRRLLRAGALIDARDRLGRTSLIDAAERGNLVVVDVLLQSGADRTIADAKGQTALDVARAKGNQRIIDD
jgi:hypothetical protein